MHNLPLIKASTLFYLLLLVFIFSGNTNAQSNIDTETDSEIEQERHTQLTDHQPIKDKQLPTLISIKAGTFIKGSDRKQREYGYDLDTQAYKRTITRDSKWYEREANLQKADTPAYQISETPITNKQYLQFINATGHQAPSVDATTWASYGLIHPFERTQRFIWKDGVPPAGRENHPVVLISYDDAVAYTSWLSTATGSEWRLPQPDEWERAARGDDGHYFPWGNVFDKTKLNSHDQGPFDTQEVGKYPDGASPHGLLDAAGQVFEWTLTDKAHKRAWVRGGSWDDKGCGVCRSAARHTRPKALKHILLGFRVVATGKPID